MGEEDTQDDGLGEFVTPQPPKTWKQSYDDWIVHVGRKLGLDTFESDPISGFGLPMALTLIRPDLDVWEPGEHNGTFRGNNHAFVTATAALKVYWSDDRFQQDIKHKAGIITRSLQAIVDANKPLAKMVRGRGFMQGIECASGEIADSISQHAFERGMIIETAGNQGQVVKCFCPLTIGEEDLRKGLKIIDMSFAAVMRDYSQLKSA